MASPLPTGLILGRKQIQYPAPKNLPANAIITGHLGSIGSKLKTNLETLGINVHGFDLPLNDVLTARQVHDAFAEVALVGSCAVFHLAADKYATNGEVEPAKVATLNISGTQNAVEAAKALGMKVILASTCKAGQPETVYGASKLIAERIVLNAGGVVGRLFNTVETEGNVHQLWAEQLDEGRPIRVCRGTERYYISLSEAVGFFTALLDASSGRYMPATGAGISTEAMANQWSLANNDAEIEFCGPRRGDRRIEPICASYESYDGCGIPHMFQIFSPHDVEKSSPAAHVQSTSDYASALEEVAA